MAITEAGRVRCRTPEFYEALVDVARMWSEQVDNEHDLMCGIHSYVAINLCMEPDGFTPGTERQLTAFLHAHMAEIKAVLAYHHERLAGGEIPEGAPAAHEDSTRGALSGSRSH
jgi:hypothetical protein